MVISALSCGLLACAGTDDEDALLARGTYLMEGLVACGNCHTPKDADANPIPDLRLAGGFVIEEPVFRAYAPNITMDEETGIGTWSDDEIKHAITQGVSRDGRQLLPVMAFSYYRNIADEDLDALVTYLRSLPPQPAD